MNDQKDAERSVANGIDREKRATATSSGTFVVVFFAVALTIAFLALQFHIGQWIGWVAIALGIVAGGIAADRKRKTVLSR